jgi:hypothetical protein
MPEFDAETKQRLRDLGFEIVEPARAVISVTPPTPEPAVLDYTEKIIGVRTVFIRPLEFVRSNWFWATGLFRVTCKKYVDPKIAYEVIPVKAKNVVFHVLGFYFEGDLVTRLTNKSEEGKEGTCVVRRLYYTLHGCPVEEGKYSWKDVAGSADLFNNVADHAFSHVETNTHLAKVRETWDKVAKGQAVDVTAHFKTGGIGSGAFWNIIQYITTGTINLRNGFDVTVHYNWRGETKEEKRRVDVRATVPVEGPISVTW